LKWSLLLVLVVFVVVDSAEIPDMES